MTPKRKKMWLWILLVPVVLIVVAWIAGHLLPERYAARETIELALSPEQAWARLHDPTRFPMSTGQCRGVELLPSEEGRMVWIEKIGGSSLRIREVVADEPTRIVREMQDTVVPFRSRNEFWIEPHGSGVRITCENEINVSSGTWHVPFFRVMLSLFGGARASIRSYVGSLGRDA